MNYENTPHTPDNQNPQMYSAREGYMPMEMSDDAISMVPVVRSDGTVEHGWLVIGSIGDRLVLQNRKGDQKLQTEAQLENAARLWDKMNSDSAPEFGDVKHRTPKEMGQAATALVGAETNGLGPDGMIIIPDFIKKALDDKYKSGSSDQSAPAPAQERIQSPQEQLAKLVAGLSEKDKELLENYSRYMRDKDLAQQESRGDDSTRYGQYAGQELLSMSFGARRIAGNYHYLRNQY